MIENHDSFEARPLRFKAAGFFRRSLASVFDALFLFPIFSGVFIALSFLFSVRWPNKKEFAPDLFLGFLLDRDSVQQKFGIAVLVMILLVTFVYQLVFHVFRSQTLGEKIVSIQVIDEYGNPPRFLRCLIRTLATWVCFACAGIGFLWIGFDIKRRGWHDWLSKTYVVVQKS